MTCNKIVSCPAPACNFWYRFLFCFLSRARMQFLIPLPLLSSMNNIKSVTCDSHKRTSRSCQEVAVSHQSFCQAGAVCHVPFSVRRSVARKKTCSMDDCWPAERGQNVPNSAYSTDLTSILDDVSYSCGTSLDELELPGRLMNVFVKDHCCTDSIEKLYYSCSFEPICVHCASEEVTECTALQFLPQCQECISQGLDRVNRPKKKSLQADTNINL